MAGYGNDNPATNGEYQVIKDFVTNSAVVLDVGGHVGEWSGQVLRTHPNFQGSIFVFEPLSIEALEKRFTGNPAIKIFHQGMYQVPCIMPLHIPLNLSCLSSVYPRKCYARLTGRVDTKQVKMNSVDNFLAEEKTVDKIDFLKIDTEGAELDVLKGATKALKDHKIKTVQFEYGGTYPDAKTTLKQVFQFLTDFGYHVFRITEKGVIPMLQWQDQYENYQYSNYLATV